MPVLDMVARDPRVTKLTLIEPDIYKPHNVERHLFGFESVGESKLDLAASWLRGRREDLEIDCLPVDVTEESSQERIESAIADADLGICAVDNESAKYHWDALMRKHAMPWTLGEVLSGGIGGFVHWFMPGGACYGCVASHLKREVTVDKAPTPDYSQPGGAVHETTIPASMASIHTIASIHALVTLQILDAMSEPEQRLARLQALGFTTMLLTMQKVPDVFDEAFKPFKLCLDRSSSCLICNAQEVPEGAALDDAIDEAISRLSDD